MGTSSAETPQKIRGDYQAVQKDDYHALVKENKNPTFADLQKQALFEQRKREAEAEEKARQESIEASNKMVREKLYNTMIEGKYPMNLNNFHPDTVKYFEKRAYDDLSSGKISQSKYDFLLIHTYQGIDNKRQKLYNEGTNTTTQPLMQTSGFDRYRTERYDYVPANYVGNKKPSSGNSGKGNNIDTIDDIRHIEELAKEQNLSTEHARIVYYSSKWKGHKDVKWTSADVAYWKTFGGKDFLFSEKKDFVNNYKDVIADAAAKYDIPIFLLAGVAFTEYGGDPMWGDDVMYTLRSFDWSGIDWLDNTPLAKPQEKTSFGNTSIQVRRALEMLNYDDTSANKRMVIDSLKDPIQNIYMAAKHLDILRNVDFSGKSASELTDDEIQIIASRYNVGPECSIEIASEADYGKSIFRNKEKILKALS